MCWRHLRRQRKVLGGWWRHSLVHGIRYFVCLFVCGLVGLFVCLFVCWFFPLENFSLIWRRHHYRWRAANFDQCSAYMAIEQWGVFLRCHTYCDSGHPFIMVISDNPWHSHLLPGVWLCSQHIKPEIWFKETIQMIDRFVGVLHCIGSISGGKLYRLL